MPQPSKCPDDVYKIMLSCWKLEAEERPDFDQILASLVALQGNTKDIEKPTIENKIVDNEIIYNQ
jgi:hypothetical protein